MERPEYLPDFDTPPLDEVVVGVQFSPPPNYSSVRAKDVWEVFKDRGFPLIQEHPPLEPSFETFGGANPQPGFQLKVGRPPLRSRLWFISEEQNNLIQFQEDRFLLNWRRHPNGEDYPRFEAIAAAFEKCIGDLENFFMTSLESSLEINQSEVSYINIIPVERYSEIGQWFKIACLDNIELENVNLSFNEICYRSDGKPYARLIHELQSVVTRSGKVRAIRLSLIFRGKPEGNSKKDAMSFIFNGREKIVTRFSELTTSTAHKNWGRNK